MQTTTLPIQVSGAGPANAPQRNSGSSEAETGQFSAALSREMEQRSQEAAPAPQPARPQAPQKAKAADKPAEARPASQQAESGDQAGEAAKASQGEPAEADEAADAAAAGEPASPAADMLALLASFNQLQKQDPAPGAAEETLAARLSGQADPLAGLEAAIKRLGQGGANAAQAGESQTGDADAARADLADTLAGMQRKGGTQEPFDLRAAAQASQPMADTPGLQARMREAAAQLEAFKAPAPTVQLVAQAQPAVFEAARAVAASDHIPARVGTPGWDNQVGQKIVWMAAGGEQSAELTLNPPDLGPVQVVLNVSGDQASVAFSTSQMEVRQALENALPRLREMMGESGIALGNATVNQGMADQRQAQGEQNGNGARSGGQLDNGQQAAESAPRTASRTTMLGDRGMVDIFA